MIKSIATAALFAAMGSAASAATMVDSLTIESDGNRTNAPSNGDVTDGGIVGLGLIPNGQTYGVAGRIVTAEDAFSFSTNAAFTVKLVDLMLDPDPLVDDGNAGFDATDVDNVPGASTNGETTAVFSLFHSSVFDATDFSANDVNDAVDFVELTSNTDPLLTGLHFAAAAGDYVLLIDGLQGDGSTYDIAISAVPVPATLPLLVGGLGALAALRRRRARG